MGAWKNSNQKPNFAQLHSRTIRVGMSKSSFTARLPCSLADSKRKMRLRIGSNIIPHIGSTRTATTAIMNKPPERPRDKHYGQFNETVRPDRFGERRGRATPDRRRNGHHCQWASWLPPHLQARAAAVRRTGACDCGPPSPCAGGAHRLTRFSATVSVGSRRSDRVRAPSRGMV